MLFLGVGNILLAALLAIQTVIAQDRTIAVYNIDLFFDTEGMLYQFDLDFKLDNLIAPVLRREFIGQDLRILENRPNHVSKAAMLPRYFSINAHFLIG